MSTWPQIPLEDEYADIVRKAARGRGIDVAALPYDDVMSVARVLHLDAGALQASYDASWAPPPIVTDDVRHHPQLPHPSNGYVFFLDGGKRAALVDPAGVPSRLLGMLRDGAYHLQYILITHKHADHCDATGDVAAAFPDARIVMNALDVHAIGALADRALKVRDGEALPFGDDCEIRALHTPGHTDGSTSYLLRSNVFTGDTLFAGSVGGAYGDVSTYADVLNSVRSKLFTLPDETIVMPGHGPPTTIALEKAHNPFFPQEHPRMTNAPFHLAIPVTDLAAARAFYGEVLGCREGRSDARWVDFDLAGHQLVAHMCERVPGAAGHSHVDGVEVPVPHFGLIVAIDAFEGFARRLRDAGVKFIIEPRLRFAGKRGEQHTMFFLDPFGNALEMKALTHPEYLFEKN